MRHLRAWAALFTSAWVLSGCPGRDAVPNADAALDAVTTDTPAAPEAATVEDAGPPPPPRAEPGRHSVSVLSTRRVVPSDGLPPEAPPNNSNNNLDVVRFNGRVYLAWRAAPDHFASAQARVNVVSSTDEVQWRFETQVSMGRDLREMRFLVVGGVLHLYVARLGTNPLAFEPQGTSELHLGADGRTWSAPQDVLPPGFIGWRGRTERGVPYLVGYTGGEHIYLFDGLPLQIYLFTTADGVNFTAGNGAATLDGAIVSRGGGSETDFVLADDGTLFGVIRNEAGDETGFGSKVCRARSVRDPWVCRHDPRKYDSPVMFWYDGEAYLIGRRNVTRTGNYDLGYQGDLQGLAVQYGAAYSNAPKRCSLWRYVQSEDRIAYVLDLPSNGDTCFAQVLTGDNPEERIVYNYSSDVEGPAVTWRQGQSGPTYLYRHVLRFTPRSP